MNGLSSEEVKIRTAEGKVNVVPGKKKGRTVPEIILTNLFTFFNLLNIIFISRISPPSNISISFCEIESVLFRL